MRTNLDVDRNKEGDEATPAAISDVETMPKVENRKGAARLRGSKEEQT
jgi:hypothetical protein